MIKSKKDYRSDEYIVRGLARAEELRKSCEIDRSETCFKGKGAITHTDLNPNPLRSQQMRKQTFW